MIRTWRAKLRSVFALVAAVIVGLRLSAAGWPWWAWLPVCILTAMAVYLAFMLTWFVYRKLTYRHLAEIARRRHRARMES